MSDSEVKLHKSGMMTFSGVDGVRLFKMRVLIQSLKLYRDTGIIPIRGITCKRMLGLVTEYTHKAYTPKKIQEAISDLEKMFDLLKLGTPIVVE